MYYIYEIKNLVNGKTYIGQRKCPKNKIPETDINYMGSGHYLKNAKEKYGIENFKKSILAITETRNNVDILEKIFIKFYRQEGKAEYNIADGGVGNCGSGESNPFYGRKHTQETRIKLSESHKGQKPWNKGIAMNEQSKMKLRESLSKLDCSLKSKKANETRKNNGYRLSDEHKQSLLNCHLGKKQSEETIRKRVEKLKGQKRSEESKLKMRESRKNYRPSEETKRKTSETLKKRYKENKNEK